MALGYGDEKLNNFIMEIQRVSTTQIRIGSNTYCPHYLNGTTGTVTSYVGLELSKIIGIKL